MLHLHLEAHVPWSLNILKVCLSFPPKSFLFIISFLEKIVRVWLGDDARRPSAVGRLADSGPSIFEELDRIQNNLNQHIQSNPLEAKSYLAFLSYPKFWN